MTVKRKKKKKTKPQHDNKTPSESLALNGISSVCQKDKGLNFRIRCCHLLLVSTFPKSSSYSWAGFLRCLGTSAAEFWLSVICLQTCELLFNDSSIFSGCTVKLCFSVNVILAPKFCLGDGNWCISEGTMGYSAFRNPYIMANSEKWIKYLV